MKTGEIQVNTLKISKKVPYAEDLQETADIIATDAKQSLDDGRMGGVEAAGHLSMAILLRSIATDNVPLTKALPLLKSLAEKKTPDPVQKIEQRTEIDMRMLIADAVSANAGALENVVAIALTAREQVRERIGAKDNRLELTPPVKATLPVQGDEEGIQEEDAGLNEFSYELRSTKIDELLQASPAMKLKSGKDEGELKEMLNSEAGRGSQDIEGLTLGCSSMNARKPVDADWSPGSEPSEISRLRKKGI